MSMVLGWPAHRQAYSPSSGKKKPLTFPIEIVVLIPHSVRRPPSSWSLSGHPVDLLHLRSGPRRYGMADSSSKRQSAAGLLSDDLLVEILSRVPYRSLCRFKCVSRSWLALCSDPDIRKKSPQTLSGFFYSSRDDDLRFLNLSGRGRPLVDPSLPFLRGYAGIEIVDCCNGLLLCRCWKSSPFYKTYVVCNPATEKWTVLPDTGMLQGIYTIRLGFEPAVSSHFTVFLLVKDFTDFQITGVGIYSSETGGWTYRPSEWGDETRVRDKSNSFFFNSTLHLTTLDASVVTVDTEGKTWRNIPSPHRTDFAFIGQSQGCLYSMHTDRYNDYQLSIWVLEGYESDQWILKHTASTLELFGMHHLEYRDSYRVTAFYPAYSLIFLTAGKQTKLMSFDINNRKARVICTLGQSCGYSYGPILPYIPCFSEWLSDGP